MKKILLTLIALVMSIGISWADKTIYLNPGVWATDNPSYAAYVWGTTGNMWIDLTTTKTVAGNTCYKFSVPDGYYTGIIFTRAENPEKAKNFDQLWNRTNDITPEGGLVDNTLYSITGWGQADYNSTLVNLAMFGTAIATSGTANLAIDGKTNTRWESAHQDGEVWQVDLGEAKEFNTIQIVWEGAYAKTFTIEAGNSVDGNGYLTGGTEIVNIENQTLSGFPHKQTLKFDATTARYIKFNGIARATGYGFSFWEFEVQNVESQTLGSLSLTVPNAARQDATLSACKVGENITITATALDTNNIEYSTEGLIFTATNGTITNAGVFTPSAAGTCTITATLEDKQATATIYAYTGDDLLLNRAASANEGATGTNLFTDGNWGNRGGLGDAVPAWAQYDLEAYYTIDFVMLKQEQANSKNYKIQFSHDGETWDDAYERTNVAGLQGDVWDYFYGNTTQNTDVRFIRFYSTEAATQYGVSIYEIAAYGTKTGEIPDAEAPVINTATVNATALGVTFTLKATDETASNINYTITDGANVYNTSGASGTEITYTVYGMTATTHSNVSVVANDGHNDSEPSVLADFTVPAIPNIPEITATDTYLLWDGNDNGAKNGFNFNDWGGGGNGANITINEKAAYQISNFKWFGSQFTEFDATPYDYLELDVFPSSETTTLAISPINLKTEGEGNQNEKGQQFSVTPGEWNKLKINVADFVAENLTTMTRVFQIKFVSKVANKGSEGATDGFSNGNGTERFIVGNIYAYKETAPAGKTVTFKNSIGWDKVYAYVADAEWNAISEEWPGDEITSTLSWSTTSDNAKWLIFNNGEVQTEDLEFTDGTEYDYGYYVVGNMNGWAKTDGYAMSRNTYCTSNVEYKLARQALTTTNQFKVALWNGKELNTHYPDGMGNSYGEHGEITADGTYNIFFRPNHDGGDDWFEKYIWAGVVGDLEDLGTDPTTGAQVLDGTWNAEEFATLDSNVKASSYDLRNVTGISSTLNVIGKTANPYCMFITSAPGKVDRNEVVWDEANSRYNGFAMFFAEPADATAPFDINTSIAPIHVVNPFFQRLFTSANNYFTMTIPFDYTLPETDKAWTMSATSTESGLSVTFTEVAAGSTLTKNTPYLYFCGTDGITMPTPGEVTIDWAAQTVDETDASFVANYSRKVTDGTENIYVLPGVVKETALQFQKAGEVSIRPFRAYLQAASAPAKINVMFDDATGIHAATAEQLEGIFNIYSIDGKLVRQNGDKMGLNKGVYIINGKKVVVK